MPSFYIPLSGLNADSTALNTIANNLSNMNTTGFKSQTTNFSDLFYQQVGTTGSGDEIQQGTGVQVASNSTDFTGGSISSTGVATDAAIDGTGFFVLDAGNGSQLYTRDGNFQVSSTGTLESTEGQAVMGYLATNGVINTSSGLADLNSHRASDAALGDDQLQHDAESGFCRRCWRNSQRPGAGL